MTEDLYAGYGALKRWTDRFTWSETEATEYRGELRDIPLCDRRVLEIGFGAGGFLAWAAAQGAAVEGTELLTEDVERARAAGYTAHGPDLTALLPDRAGAFDLIVAFDVLEHIERERLPALFRAVHTLLAADGLFLARVPNGQSPLGLLHQNGDITHLTALSVPIIRHLAQITGFTVERAGNAFRAIPHGRSRSAWIRLRRTLRWRMRYWMRDRLTGMVARLYGLGDLPFDPNLTVLLRRGPATKETSTQPRLPRP